MYGQPQPDSNMYTMQGFAQMQQGLIPNPQGTMPNSFVGQRFRGTVKSYSESNGYGFIGGDEITAALGKDVFVHQREVTEVTGIARPQIPAGVAVTFAVTINPKGQPQARELRFEDQSFLQLQAMGQPVSGQQPGGGGGAGGGQLGQNGSFQYQYVQGGRRFRGFVRSFSQINGFGFVGSDEITQTFGKDAFLHFRELQTVMGQEKPTIPSGTWLTFTITINQKGQPQARDVQFEQFDQSASQPMGALDQSSPAYAASAAVAALGFTPNQQMGQQQIQQTQPPQGNNNPSQVYVSDAEAYARVQADIEKFQQEVAAQRAKTAAEALGGGGGGGDDAQQRQVKTEDEADLRRAREKKMKEQGDFVSPSRSRSRSPRRREGWVLVRTINIYGVVKKHVQNMVCWQYIWCATCTNYQYIYIYGVLREKNEKSIYIYIYGVVKKKHTHTLSIQGFFIFPPIGGKQIILPELTTHLKRSPPRRGGNG